MDQRDAMALQGSASYYMQRGGPGSGIGMHSGLRGSHGIRPLSNPNIQFESEVGVHSIGSTFPIEPSSAILPQGVNASLPSSVPQSEHVKRKRGRPRKYGPEGAVALALTPLSSASSSLMTTTQKRGRGRPPGSGNKQRLASFGDLLSGSAGMSFTPHVISVAIGEDVATKIMSFSQQGPRAICILSANGSVSTVTLRQPSTSGGTITYEGRFEILCLSGSYLVSDNGGSRNQNGGLTVSLASPDGRVVGGGVGGMLIAATPVQIIVGSFIWGGSKTKNKTKSIDSDQPAVHNPITQAGMQPNQILTSTSSLGVWPGSRQVDMRYSVHVDIDLMRG